MTPALFLLLLSWSACLLNDPLMSSEMIYKDTLRFHTLSQDMRNNELLNSLRGVYSRGTDNDHFDRLKINGWSVCDGCYQRIYGISPATWTRRQRDVRAGKACWEHGNFGKEGRFKEKGYLSRAWMTKWFASLGDYQPDTGEVHLPPMDQKDVHAEMWSELGDTYCISLSYFYEVWSKDFPEVVIPPEQRLGKCRRCADLHEDIMDAKDKETREALKQQRMQHIREVRAERLVYHKWRRICKEQPDKYLLIILDGMDQNKTNVPSFNCGEQPCQVTCRIIGAVVHGRTKQVYCYAVTNFTKETNTMIEVHI